MCKKALLILILISSPAMGSYDRSFKFDEKPITEKPYPTIIVLKVVLYFSKKPMDWETFKEMWFRE